MSFDPVKNFAISKIATAPDPDDSGLSCAVTAGEGALFPLPSSSGAFNAIVFPDREQPTVANAEIVRVTARSTDTFTIVRAQEGTTARHIVVGDIIMFGATAKVWNDVFNAFLTMISDKSAVTTLADTDTMLIDNGSALKKITVANVAIEIDKRHRPVGSVYTNGTVSTNPATLLGFGTWSVYGAGRVTVGFATGDADFGTAGATGGEKTHVLSVGELATHTHTQDSHTHTISSSGAHTHTTGTQSATHTHTPNGGYGFITNQYINNATSGAGLNMNRSSAPTTTSTESANHYHDISSSGAHTHTSDSTTATNQNAGSSTAHNNLQPFVVAYQWIRTA